MDPAANLAARAELPGSKALHPPSSVPAPAPLRRISWKRRAADRRRLQALRYCIGHRLRLARAQNDDGVAESLLQHAAHDAFVLMLAGTLTPAQWERVRDVLRAERLRRTRAATARSSRARTTTHAKHPS